MQNFVNQGGAIFFSTHILEVAEKLAEMLKEKLGNDLLIDFVVVNPTCGSHCGPDAVGISFYSKCR